MDQYKLPPELSSPPPEPNHRPELELAALPPEFGQGSGPPPEPAEKKRRLRRLLSIPVLLLSGFLCFRGVTLPPQPPEPAPPETTETLQTETAAATTETEPLPIPADPELSGTLEAFPGGEVEAVFRFVPPAGEDRDYDFRVAAMGQRVAWEGETTGLSLLDEPWLLPVEGDGEQGYAVRYEGGSAAASIPEGAQLRLYLILEDQSTGERWEIETNPVDPVEQILPYETWPLGDGKLTITVYNDTPDITFPSAVQTEAYVTILDLVTMPESEFTGYELPSAYTPDGFDFAGWVVHVNNPMDLSAGTDVFSEYGGDPPPEALNREDNFVFRIYGPLTREDVERVPPAEDGVRYVNVHAVWIVQEPEEELILLDDGTGKVTAYGMESPLYSEGYLYLCNFPVPEREGLEFDGWYDENGKRVDYLVCYFSFVKPEYDADGSFVGYDWGSYEPVRLVAHWRGG